MTNSKPWIAVDIDGVLADMVGSILPVLRRAGHYLNRDDITEWNFPIGDKMFGEFIDECYQQRQFVMDIRPIQGAVEGVRKLCEHFNIGIVTARPEHTREWTTIWLQENGFAFDELVFAPHGQKHATGHEFEWLIDDYQVNVNAFLKNRPEAFAVVFDQPWNKEADALAIHQRWLRACNWHEVLLVVMPPDEAAAEALSSLPAEKHHNEPPPEGMIRFSSGAVRSSDRAQYRYDLIAPEGMRRLAMTYAEGAAKYSDNNWKKGMPVSDILNHAVAHLYLYQDGDTSEDHLAHAAWGLFAAMHFERHGPQWVDCGPNKWAGEVGTP